MINKQLSIKCRFKIMGIRRCTINSVYGKHTQASFTAVVESDNAKAVITDTADEKVTIMSRDNDTMAEQVMFSGIVESVELIAEGGYTVLELKAVSNTWQMDIQRKSRSFQNLSMTYKEVAKEIAGGYGADLIWNVSDRQLEHPLIQYRETDYQFITRILSHLNEGITAGDSDSAICIHAGMREGNDKGEIVLKQYSYIVKPFLEKRTGGIRRTKCTGYKISDTDFVRIGDAVQINGTPYYVMEAFTVFARGSLACSCLVFPKKCFEMPKISAEALKGTVLVGEIIEARHEFVKMHLDIDRLQDSSEAYEFPWKPLTGNLLYCMPEIGTRAALYFKSGDESAGEAICSIRENGSTCSGLSDYNNRYFATDGQKQMYMKPSEMGLLNMTGHNAEISLNDRSGLGLKTNNEMSLLAEGQVVLRGRNVTITTPKEATLVRKDLLSPTVINFCNAFDSIGSIGSFASNGKRKAAEKKSNTMPVHIEEKYTINDIVVNMLSNIPAVDTGSPVMESVAASMPVFNRTGIREKAGHDRDTNLGGKK